MFEKLLEDRINNIETLPNAFVSAVDKNNAAVLKQVLRLARTLKRDGGKILLNATNLAIANQITKKLEEVLLLTDFQKAYTAFIDSFDLQYGLIDDYFKDLTGKALKPKRIYANAIKAGKQNASIMLGNLALKEDFSSPLTEIFNIAVSTQDSLSNLIDNITDNIMGTDQIDPSLTRYAKTWGRTLLAQADANYTETVAQDLGFQYYLYDGPRLKMSRDFCKERKGKIYHIEEIRLWPTNEGSQESNPSPRGTWQGMIKGTNSRNILTLRGGFNCVDIFGPLLVSMVPKEVIKRNEELGFHKN